jgi:hypothetical protein
MILPTPIYLHRYSICSHFPDLFDCRGHCIYTRQSRHTRHFSQPARYRKGRTFPI